MTSPSRSVDESVSQQTCDDCRLGVGWSDRDGVCQPGHVVLCPKHAAVDDLLAACEGFRAWRIQNTIGVGSKRYQAVVDKVDAAIAHATGGQP